MRGFDISPAGGWIEVASNVHPPGEVVVSMSPVIVFAKDPGCELEQLRAELQGRWRPAARAMMVLLSAHGLPPAQIAGLLDLPRRAVVLAEDETHLNLLPHVRASWTLRAARPQVPRQGRTGRSPRTARSR